MSHLSVTTHSVQPNYLLWQSLIQLQQSVSMPSANVIIYSRWPYQAASHQSRNMPSTIVSIFRKYIVNEQHLQHWVNGYSITNIPTQVTLAVAHSNQADAQYTYRLHPCQNTRAQVTGAHTTHTWQANKRNRKMTDFCHLPVSFILVMLPKTVGDIG